MKFLYGEQKLTGEQIVEHTGVSKSTVYRAIKEKD
ncbi:HTH domain-containing protein [Pseudomonas aeruginosa]|nr:HTH domain-containing protein [Pseudomonas aeruginosa]